MKIAVLGTGTVGRTVGAALAGLGHEVTLGTRDVQATLERTEPDAAGTPPLARWCREHPQIGLARFADAVDGTDLVVNATSGQGSVAALQAAAGPLDRLDAVVVLDIANPLDFSRGMPPTLSVKDTDSLAEQIQRAFPHVRVVKALNTMSAHVMVDPRALAGGEHTVFVSGDDAAAKKTVEALLRDWGWSDVVDLGDLSTARGTEMLLPLWLRLWGALGTADFNLKLVR